MALKQKIAPAMRERNPVVEARELERRNKYRDPLMEVKVRSEFDNILPAKKNGVDLGLYAAEAYKRSITKIATSPENFWGVTEGMLSVQAKKELEKRSKEQERVHFLELGPGFGHGLRLAEGVAANVFAHALGLNYPHVGSHLLRGNWIQDCFEKIVVRKKGSREGYFDVIQSRLSLYHAMNKAIALENALNSLKYGGKLYHVMPGKTFNSPELLKALERQGFAIEHTLEEKNGNVHVITRKTGAVADLRAFYEDTEFNIVPIRAR